MGSIIKAIEYEFASKSLENNFLNPNFLTTILIDLKRRLE